MLLTIVLDSGGFLMDDSSSSTHLDVGYFETPGTSDIEVSEGDQPAQPLPNSKLGNRNETINVQHVAADGRVKSGVKQSEAFKKNILKKDELYPTDTPDFLVSEYDCILRFHSGDFESSDLRARDFNEHRLSDHSATGQKKQIRAIANDVLVQFDLAKGEELRLRRDDGTDLWSSSSLVGGTTNARVKLLADITLDDKYFGKALKHRGPHYHLPNPDPPPMNGNEPGTGGGGGGP